jgi:hypothetical protein
VSAKRESRFRVSSISAIVERIDDQALPEAGRSAQDDVLAVNQPPVDLRLDAVEDHARVGEWTEWTMELEG